MILKYNAITFKLQSCYVALHNNVRTILITEMARIWKEAVMVYFLVLSLHLLGKNMENHGKSIKTVDNLAEIQTRYFQKYKSRALLFY
jgi:hypothetical protein